MLYGEFSIMDWSEQMAKHKKIEDMTRSQLSELLLHEFTNAFYYLNDEQKKSVLEKLGVKRCAEVAHHDEVDDARNKSVSVSD